MRRHGVGRVVSTVFALSLLLSVGGALVLSGGCRNRGDAEGEGTEGDAAAPATAAQEPVTPTEQRLVLYFPGSNDDQLHAESRTVVPIAAPEERAKQCLEELIRGPQPPLLAAVPDRVRLRQVYLLADGTAFVDLSGEMLAHRGGSLGELQTVYAIVDTLTANIREIRRVGILIDGRIHETLAGHVDISEPLRADYQYVDPAARPASPEPAGAETKPGGGGVGGAGASGAPGAEGSAGASGTSSDADPDATRDGTAGEKKTPGASGDGRR